MPTSTFKPSATRSVNESITITQYRHYTARKPVIPRLVRGIQGNEAGTSAHAVDDIVRVSLRRSEATVAIHNLTSTNGLVQTSVQNKGNDTAIPSLRGSEATVAIHNLTSANGLLRYARNDGVFTIGK